MAITSEIGVFVVSVSDSIFSKGTEVFENFAAPTNQYDKDVNLMICLTILGVSLIVCVGVYACFKEIASMKRHAKEKDHELDMKREENNKEIWKLQHENIMAEMHRKLKKEKWEQDMANEDHRKEDEKKIIKLEKDLAVANAVLSEKEKCKN